jgi:UDP-N-acetylglucosamine 4,6-dehydratase/5-epimerase
MRRNFYHAKNIEYIIGDVRDKDRLLQSTLGVDILFHLAALKHVPVCEENPFESVQTNILGAQNVINVAIQNNIRKVIDVSTDKAVDPFNIYGTCKAV